MFLSIKFWSDSNIMCLKEEGGSSRVNKAYDKYFAIGDKSSTRQSLSYLHKATQINKCVVDQWQIIHAGIFPVRKTTPATWKNSFRACNMDSRAKLSFPRWCEKIKDALQSSNTLKEESIE